MKKEISPVSWGVLVAILGCGSRAEADVLIKRIITLCGVFPDLRWEFPMLVCVWERWGCSWLRWLPAGDGLVSGVWNGAALALLFLTGTQTAFGPHNLEKKKKKKSHTRSRNLSIWGWGSGQTAAAERRSTGNQLISAGWGGLNTNPF